MPAASSATTTSRAPSAAPAHDEVDAHHLELRRRDRARVGGARRRQRLRPRPRACSWIGATIPCTTPRCSRALADREHARVRGDQRVVDDDPAVDLQARRRARASTCGRMPTEITTRSASSSSRRRSAARRARPAGRSPPSRAPSSTVTPSASIAGAQQRGGAGVELALHQAVDEVHDRRRAAERARAPYAASRPSSPPPITTARRPRAAPRDRRAVLRAAEDVHAVARRPAIGGTSASEPVHSTHAVDSAPSQRRVPRRSSASTRVSSCTSTPWSSYQPAGPQRERRPGPRRSASSVRERDAVVRAGAARAQTSVSSARRRRARGPPRAPPGRRCRRR